MDISIVEAEKRANGTLNLKDFYTVYLIETKYVKKMCIYIIVKGCYPTRLTFLIFYKIH